MYMYIYMNYFIYRQIGSRQELRFQHHADVTWFNTACKQVGTNHLDNMGTGTALDWGSFSDFPTGCFIFVQYYIPSGKLT